MRAPARGPSATDPTTDAHDQRVHVNVEIQRRAEPLDDRHRPAAAIPHAGAGGLPPQNVEHGTHIHSNDRPAQRVVPGQQVPNPIGQTQREEAGKGPEFAQQLTRLLEQ